MPPGILVRNRSTAGGSQVPGTGGPIFQKAKRPLTNWNKTLALRATAIGANPIFREAQDRRHSSPNPEYRNNNDVPDWLREQRRLSILCWNPGLRRGKEGAIEKHIAGKSHIIALQEALEYLHHEFLTSHFHVTHYAGCAVLLNKDTSDIKVSSVYLHDTRNRLQQVVKEGQSRWVPQAVIFRASFRRLLRNGKFYFTMIS